MAINPACGSAYLHYAFRHAFFMSKASNLPAVLTRRLIERLASDRSLQRGENYFAGGRVKALVKRGDTLRAKVTGTEEYEVRLTAVGGRLEFECSCPVGMDGNFCKHCVAVSLAWLDSQKPGGRGQAGSETDRAMPVVNLGDLRPWLLKQSMETLVDLLLDVAERDDRLREKLLRNAARATSKRIDFPAYRDSITRATAIRGFVSYHEAYGFARGVEEAVEPLKELLAEGHATAVIELAEHALKRVEKAMGQIDDSDGGLGGVLELLQDLHLRACLIAKPDPEALATRLFDWELRGDWDVFHDSATKYADAFGRKGLARYRQLAEEAWALLADLKPGAKEDFSSARFRLTHIMEQAAHAGGNLDALVKIKTKDLSSARHFLDIARLYANAQRPDEALAWAERGMAAFRDNPDRDLRKFIAEEYRRRGRHDDAMALMWAQFEECPCLRDYQELKEHAGQAIRLARLAETRFGEIAPQSQCRSEESARSPRLDSLGRTGCQRTGESLPLGGRGGNCVAGGEGSWLRERLMDRSCRQTPKGSSGGRDSRLPTRGRAVNRSER